MRAKRRRTSTLVMLHRSECKNFRSAGRAKVAVANEKFGGPEQRSKKGVRHGERLSRSFENPVAREGGVSEWPRSR